MKTLVLIATGISLTFNALLLFWGKEQVEAARSLDKGANEAGRRHQEAVAILGGIAAGRIKKSGVVNFLKERDIEFYEKEGELVAKDLAFTVVGDEVASVRLLFYPSKNP